MKNRILELRNEKGISGAKLAEMLGISPQYLYNLEKGTKRLNEDILVKLAEVFNTSTDYILGLSNIRSWEDPLADLSEDARKKVEDYTAYIREKDKGN